MLLWDIIRDWFVQNIWGGTTHTGQFVDGCFGYTYYQNQGGDWVEDFMTSNSPLLHFGNAYLPPEGEYMENISMGFGDWLSTTSTIIVLVAICVGFYFLVRWLFRLTAGLIAGRG